MVLSLRQGEILEIARGEGRVGVEDLALRFGVTLQTIRRDLGEMADAGLLERVHGGAVLRAGVANTAYTERQRQNAEAKAAIGVRCAALIPDNASVILNIGTTTEAVARALLGHRNLTVVTNNLNVANILAASDSCAVMVAGGALRRTDGGLVGELTTQFFEQFKVDFAVIGCSALDADGDLLDFDLAEVGVARAILRQSRTRLLVADASKLERQAPVRLGSLAELDGIVTDRALPDALVQACADWGTAVHLA